MKNNQDLLDPKDFGTIKRPKTPKKKEEKSMKKPVIIAVTLTLITVAAFAATFIAGMNYANQLHADKQAAVEAATVQLKDQPSQ